jgi:hypothetical protein
VFQWMPVIFCTPAIVSPWASSDGIYTEARLVILVPGHLYGLSTCNRFLTGKDTWKRCPSKRTVHRAFGCMDAVLRWVRYSLLDVHRLYSLWAEKVGMTFLTGDHPCRGIVYRILRDPNEVIGVLTKQASLTNVSDRGHLTSPLL